MIGTQGLRDARVVAVAILTLLVVRPVQAQKDAKRVLGGAVTDVAGNPVPFANILIEGESRAIADELGRFNVAINKRGAFELTVRRLGFREASIQ